MRHMRSILLRTTALLFAMSAIACAPDTDAGSQSTTYFPGPGEAWEHRAPAEVGLDSSRLAEAVEYAASNETQDVRVDFSDHAERFGEPDGPLPQSRGGSAGLIVRDGYIVAEWGDTERPDLCFSATKSFVSTMVGLAVDDGLIDDVDDPVGQYIHDGRFDSPHNAKVTWRHLLQQTSEWEGVLFDRADTADFFHRRGRTEARQEPGTYYEYNDVRVNLASYGALLMLRRPLPDVFRERIMEPIGASDTWTWHGYRNSDVDVDGRTVTSVSGGGHWGGGLWISARDMARFGYLFLQRGEWDGKQLISESWIDAATTPSELRSNYGFMWWLTPDEADVGVPSPVFAARGHGGNVIWIDTRNDLVVVTRWFGGGWQELQDLILASVLEPAAVEAD